MKNAINVRTARQKFMSYKKHPMSFVLLVLVLISALITVGVLISLVGYILIKGIPNLSWDLFAWKYTSENVSMTPAIINTVTIVALSLLIAVPLGVFSAIYLVEYAKRGSRLVNVIRMTTETLSGIPSIVYGLFGFLMFNITFKFGYSVLSGILTLSIMVLPTMMRTTEEALKAVPDIYREGSFGLGAGKLRTVFRVVIPSAMPGIMSGVILSVGRIVGETAALIFTAGTVTGVATSLFSSGRTLSIHLYALLNEGLYTDQAYATAVVLLLLVVGINALSAKAGKRFSVR